MSAVLKLGIVALAGALAAGQGSARAVVTAAAPAADGSVTLAVRVTARDLALGAYQGSLRYAPGTLEILRVATPGGDGTRVVNPADSAQGIVRFAGFTVSGFRTDTVVTVVVKPRGGLPAARVQAVLDVAADVDGKAIAKEQLSGAALAP